MKRLILLTLVVLACVFVKAETWTDGNGTTWEYTITSEDPKTASLAEKCITGTIPQDIVIPATINGYTITAIGDNAFHDYLTIASMDIPNGVTEIGNSAFQGCSNLRTVNIPTTVRVFGNNTFGNCEKLQSITIPEGVEEIAYQMFACCHKLQSVVLPQNSLTKINPEAFLSCENLSSINIPNTVREFGYACFRECASLKTINIPAGMERIPGQCFYACGSLESITIPEGVIAVEWIAFAGCEGVTSLTLPASLLTIGVEAFNMSNVSCVEINSTTPLDYRDGLPQNCVIVVPDGKVSTYQEIWPDRANKIVSKSDNALKSYTLTAQNTISDLANKIGEANLQRVTNLKLSGTINSYDITVIRNKMINLLNLDLEDVSIVANEHEYVTGYGSENNVIGNSFLRDSKINSIVLPTTVTKIDDYAFQNCKALRSVTNLNNITSIGESAFDQCSLLTNVLLPNGLTSLGRSAFAGCKNITAVVLPNAITEIPEGAFWGCEKLVDVALSPQTERIGFRAFTSCSSLTEMHLPPYTTTIEDEAFNDCGKLNKIYAYMVDVPLLSEQSFNTYTSANLYIPQFLYYNYFYDTNWSHFLSVNICDLKPGDYETIYMEKSDCIFSAGVQRPSGTPDAEVGLQAGLIVEGEELALDETTQSLDGEGQGGSLIADGGDGDTNNNMPVNTLKVKIQVQADRWYFFCFPFDVTIADCEYPGQYAWRTYNSTKRAGGYIGWENVTGSTLTARQGYIFQSSANGKLIITFNQPTFGGDRPKPLVSYTTGNGNAADASWNFVGNPYSCFYEFDENDFTSPITVWNGTGYEAYRPGDDDYHLQPYEAFFVQKPSDVEQIAFGKERRETYRQSQEKKTHQAKMRKAQGIQAERLLINLNIGNQETENIDRTRLVLNENASRKYELECDAAKFISDQADAQLYMVENGVQMAINERPTKGDIRMGYKAKKAGTLRIEASRMDLPMMLVDTKTNQTFDLSLGSYEFETEAGTFNSRFMLRPSDEATAIKELTAKTGVAIGTQDGGLSIGGAEGKIISIYTTNGAQVAQQAGNGFVSLSSGLYIVKVGNQSAKIYVK